MEKIKGVLIRLMALCLGLTFIIACEDDEWDPGMTEVTGDFDFSLSQEKAPAILTITDKSINGATYLWKFPGAEPSMSFEKEPKVTYKTGGTYEIILSVCNGRNQQVATKSITIQTPDVAAAFDYTYKNGSDYSPATINFADKSTGAASWSWSFDGGDPASSNQQNPGDVLFTNSGKYPVKLQVVNGNSSEEITEYVKVYPGNLLCNSPTEQVWMTPLMFSGMQIGFIAIYFDKERKDPNKSSNSKSAYRLYIAKEAAAMLGEKDAIDYQLPASWDWDETNGIQTISFVAYYGETEGPISFEISSLNETGLVFGKIVFDPIFKQLLPDEMLQLMAASATFNKVKPI
jgi:PKD repeat protein